MRIAMWSGPRNISTALMRSWGNRDDCYVCDEPLYAHYLKVTGLSHPGRTETLAHHDSEWESVVAWLTGPIPDDRTVWYQKQMAHHMLPEIDREWVFGLSNCFLIREPAEMLTSLIEFIDEPRVEDTGLPQQLELFKLVQQETGTDPPVIDGRDVLLDPPGLLSKLCDRLELPFDEAMLQWPPGIRETDGAWAPFWYDKVKHTTGFAKYRPKGEPVPNALTGVLDRCNQLYEQLATYRIT